MATIWAQDFENYGAPWWVASFDCTVGWDNTGKLSGQGSMAMTGDGIAGDMGSVLASTPGVTGGAQYTIRCDARTDGTTRNVRVFLNEWNSAGTPTSSGALSNVSVTSSPTACSWTFTANASSAYIQVGMQVLSAGAGQVVYFDNFAINTGTTTTYPTTAGIKKVSQRAYMSDTVADGTSAFTLDTGGAITPGNYLIMAFAVENTGTNGAAPGVTITDTANNSWSSLTWVLQDPGAAGDGIAGHVAYTKVTAGYSNNSVITLQWTTGTPRACVLLDEFSGISQVSPIAVTQVSANGNSTTPSVTIAPTAARQMVYTAAFLETNYTTPHIQDQDATDGDWISNMHIDANGGTVTTSTLVTSAYKVVTGTSSQTWTPTFLTALDWAALAVVFASNEGYVAPGAIGSRGSDYHPSRSHRWGDR